MSTPDLNGGQPPETKPHSLSADGPRSGAAPPHRKSGRRDPVVLIVIAIVISILLYLGIRKARHSPLPAAVAGELEGRPAPDFRLQSTDGKTMKLSDFRGKAVVVNFWATYCVPCKVEMPWLVDFEKNYGPQGLAVLGVAMDEASPGEIASFAKELRVNYPVLIGKADVGAQYGGPEYLPSTFYISREGKILDHVFGLVSRAEIESNIRKALGQPAAK